MNLLMPKNIKWKKPHKPAIKPFRPATAHAVNWREIMLPISGLRFWISEGLTQAQS